MMDWVDLMGRCRDDSHMRNLFTSSLEGRYVDRYYAYNVNYFRYDYVNGEIRYYRYTEPVNDTRGFYICRVTHMYTVGAFICCAVIWLAITAKD